MGTMDVRGYDVAYSGRPAELERLLGCGVPIAAVQAGGVAGQMPNTSRQYLPDLNALQAQAARCHLAGVRFEVLLDALCFGGRQLWERGRPLLGDYIDQLAQAGVDGVLVSDPAIVELVRSRSDIAVVVARAAAVDSVAKARFFQDLGVAAITLDPRLNRNEPLLRRVIEALDMAEPRLVLNDGCLLDCPYRPYHQNLLSHPELPVFGEYYTANCAALRLQTPGLILSTPFIRPEERAAYAALGVGLSLAPRAALQPLSQVEALLAYGRGRYEGNLVALLGQSSPWGWQQVWIENRALDGAWAEKWRGCLAQTDCAACGYCDELAAQVVELREERKGDER